MKVPALIFGLGIVAMAPVSAAAQARAPQIVPMGPTMMRPPAAPLVVSPPPAVATPRTGCFTHQETRCDQNNFCQNVPVMTCQ